MTSKKELAKQLVLAGHSYREIGRRLGINHLTVKRWTDDEYRKLDNKAQNIRYNSGKKPDYKSEVYRAHRRKYVLDRYHNNVIYRLRHSLRRRLYTALKRGYKSGSAVMDLGCSIEELKRYLESKFTPGMSWDNYGKWHIDHMVPLDYFDLSKREELLVACHYTNLQPMWSKDNLVKSNTVA